MECSLAEKQCVPCRGGVEPLKGEPVRILAAELVGGWDVVDEHHLSKLFKFGDFAHALDFVNVVGRIAEDQHHHPDITLSWGRVGITILTHKIDGLTESDFVLAAKIEAAA